MFERFTDQARRVVVLAQEEANRLSHNYIGTEHLLLALLAGTDGVACRVLSSLEVTLGEVRAEVEDIIGRGGGEPRGHVPFTPRAKTVLEMSLREALRLGHDYIGTEHLLLGLVREGGGVAARVLERRGIDQPAVQRRVMEALGEVDPEVEEPGVKEPGVEEPEATPAAEAAGPLPRSETEGPAEVLVESLLAENARLRREVDRLRDALRRLAEES